MNDTNDSKIARTIAPPSTDLSQVGIVVEDLRRQGIDPYVRMLVESEDGQVNERLFVTPEAFRTVCLSLYKARDTVAQEQKNARSGRRGMIAAIVLLVLGIIIAICCYPTLLESEYSRGYAAGKKFVEDTADSDYSFYDSIDTGSSDSAVNSESSLTPVSFSNGEIIQYPQSEQLCPLTVEVTDENSYYIFLDSTTTQYNDMAFMVSPSSSAEVLVPLGTYEIYYASGETWYGEEVLFGSSTSYNKCEGTFDFYDDGEYYQGWTLELYMQDEGNMDTEIISAEDFPT